MPDLHLPTPVPDKWRPELTGEARAAAWLAFIAPPKPMPDAPVMTLRDAIDEHLAVMDERVWTPGDPPLLPPLPASAYGVAAVPLDEAPSERARRRWFRR